jgi:hypothetical protein
MRSTWPYLAAVVAVGVGVGTWIAGLPSSGTRITVADGGAGPLGPGSDTTVVLLPTSSFPPITVTPTTEPARNPVPSTSVPITALPATGTTVPVASAASTTTTTTASPTTTTTLPPAPTPAPTAETTVAPAQPLDRSQVRLVLANGDGRYNLVGRNVDRLTPLGYTAIDQTDAPRKVDRTVLYVRPGFDDEAARLAADLLVPGALIEPLPAEPVTINDELGDIIVVLGPDAVR